MTPIVFHPEALEDIASASAYYEEQRPGLGEQYEAAVEEATRRIVRMPMAFTPYGSAGLRRCVVNRFPYSIFFLEREADIWVLAVANARRRPDYWMHRFTTNGDGV